MAAFPETASDPSAAVHDASALKAMRSDVLSSIRQLVAEDARQQPALTDALPDHPADHSADHRASDDAQRSDKRSGILRLDSPITSPDAGPMETPAVETPAKRADAGPHAHRHDTQTEQLRIAALRAAIRAREGAASAGFRAGETRPETPSEDCRTEARRSPPGGGPTATLPVEPARTTCSDEDPMENLLAEHVPVSVPTGQANGGAVAEGSADDPSIGLFVEMIRGILRQELRDNPDRMLGALRSMIVDEIVQALAGSGAGNRSR